MKILTVSVILPQEFETHVLSKEAIDKFTMTALVACLNLVDTLPDTVYRVCDLLITITKRNGEVWRDEMLDTLVADVSCFFFKVGCRILANQNATHSFCALIAYNFGGYVFEC